MALTLGAYSTRMVKGVVITPTNLPAPDFRREIRNHERNRAAGHRELQRSERNRPAVIVGGGGSQLLGMGDLPEGDIFAAGISAAARLNAVGHKPEFLVISNPDTKRLPPAHNYALTTLCDPSLFRRYPNAFCFRADLGVTAGYSALWMAFEIGYRDIHLVGFDSSGEGPILVRIDGREFRTTQKLHWQSQEIVKEAARMIDKGARITVHGDGLLPATLHGMYRPSTAPVHAACYDLASSPANFDFLNWLINGRIIANRAGHKGPIRVRFLGAVDHHGDDMKLEQRQQMLDHVMRPALSLFDAVEDNSIDPDMVWPTHYKCMVDAVRNGEPIPRINVGNGAFNPRRITITLREASYGGDVRNSNVEAWKEFARRRQDEGYEVLFIRDTARASEPLDCFKTDPRASRDLIYRAWLYESSAANLAMATGPVTLLLFGHRPFVTFFPLHHLDGYGPALPEWWTIAAGVTPPGQFPWFLPGQKIVWAKDDLDQIETAWKEIAYALPDCSATRARAA